MKVCDYREVESQVAEEAEGKWSFFDFKLGPENKGEYYKLYQMQFRDQAESETR